MKAEYDIKRVINLDVDVCSFIILYDSLSFFADSQSAAAALIFLAILPRLAIIQINFKFKANVHAVYNTTSMFEVASLLSPMSSMYRKMSGDN